MKSTCVVFAVSILSLLGCNSGQDPNGSAGLPGAPAERSGKPTARASSPTPVKQVPGPAASFVGKTMILKGNGYLITRKGDTVQYEYLGAGEPPEAVARVYMESEVEMDGAMYSSRSIHSSAKFVGMAGEVDCPWVLGANPAITTVKVSAVTIAVGASDKADESRVQALSNIVEWSGDPAAIQMKDTGPRRNGTDESSSMTVDRFKVEIRSP